MKKKFIFLFSIAIITMFYGCTGTRVVVKDYSMKAVERPKDAKERYGEVNTTMLEEDGKKKMVFEDELVKAFFYFNREQINIVIENKTDYTIKINWDNGAYIGKNGVSKRIIHSGVKLIDRNNPQTPSIIVRKGKLVDLIIPSDNIYYSSGEYGGWKYLPLISESDLQIGDKKLENITLLLPIEIEGIINDYLFNFELKVEKESYQY